MPSSFFRSAATSAATTMALALALGPGCERAPAEPDARPAASDSAHVARPLRWTVPPAWNVDGTASRGTRRAKYAVPATGNAKHGAEVLVLRLSAARKLDERLAQFLGRFEGPGSKLPRRETLEVGALKVTLVEVAATYRYPMGPPAGPQHKAAAHLIKNDWRGIAATVNAKSRGLWFFRMVGPDDTVAAARSSFRAMIESLK